MKSRYGNQLQMVTVFKLHHSGKRAYMIYHRRCNKYVRQRVCDEPDLIRYSHSVREATAFNCVFDKLPLGQSTGPYVPSLLVPQSVDRGGMSAEMRHVPCNVELRRLTIIPLASAPNAPTMESYGENDEVIP